MTEHYGKTFCLDVQGDYACFTRPEMKVERVSYDVITPSAARAIFSAIFWKPAIKWNIKKIEVLSPIKWISVRRNEVGAIAPDLGKVIKKRIARKSPRPRIAQRMFSVIRFRYDHFVHLAV